MEHNLQPMLGVTSWNVLFLGETNVAERSIIDFIAGSGDQEWCRPAEYRASDDTTRTIALDGKTFALRASPAPANESMSPAMLMECIQNALADRLRRNGVHVHLLMYCLNALHSTEWIHDVHRIIVSHPALFPDVPAVAVIVGISDVDKQERWWASNEPVFAKQGLRFDDHTFIRVMTADTQSPQTEDFSESRRSLHALILQNCVYALNSETNSDSQCRKPSCQSTDSKAIDIVLLGEVGVGKSSLINLIAGRDLAKVSSDTIGCTQAAVKYTFQGKGRTLHLYDTPGLVDPQMGIEHFVSPIDTIHKLICKLGNGNGPDLFLFCIDKSKPTAALQRNYILFREVICRGKVPFAFAITKLEEGRDADEWRSQHEATIRKYDIQSSGYIGFWRGKGLPGPEADLEQKEALLSFLIARTARQKSRMGSLLLSLPRMVIQATSSLLAQTPEKVLMKQCGLEEQTARELASRIVFPKESYDKAHT